MAECPNSTIASNAWGLYSKLPDYGEHLVILVVFLYRFKIQAQRHGRQGYINVIRDFGKNIVRMLIVLEGWCTFMKDYDDIADKNITNVKVVPYKNETVPELKEKDGTKHPWDIAQEIMKEQKQAALSVKWGTLPLGTLMDEQFLLVLHAVEEITDVAPLQEAAKQLPKKIYKIIKQHQHLEEVPAELTDQLVFDISKTYFYSIIEFLCKLIRTIQQAQRTSLVSLAKIVQEQRDEIKNTKHF